MNNSLSRQGLFNYPQILDPISIITDKIFHDKVIDYSIVKDYFKKNNHLIPN